MFCPTSTTKNLLNAGLVLLITITTGAPKLVQAQESNALYELVDGYGVYGYADGQEIANNWYPTSDEAAQAKRKMELSTVLTADGRLARYYDSVEVIPEQRRVPRRSTPRNSQVQAGNSLPGAAKPVNQNVRSPRSRIVGRWVGSETANDTSSLTFDFREGNQVIARDDLGSDWRGTWRMIDGTNTVVIQLTSPHEVNYSGQMVGDQISGQAGRPGSLQWTWSVRRSSL